MQKHRSKSEAPFRIEVDGPIVRSISRVASDLADCVSVILSAFARCMAAIFLGIGDVVEAGKDWLVRHLGN